MIPFELNDHFKQTFTVSDSVYEGFIQIFKDHNPLHTDKKFAADHGFADKVMHGNILNGFLSFFIGECLPTKKVIIHSQEIQFKNALYLNDELFFSAQVTGVYESVGAIEFKFSFKNKDSKVMAKGKIQIGLLK
jgi:3-hydroxybutyryl-CoA dehydratase